MNAEGFDAVEHRPPEGHAVYVRGRLSGRIFRVSPARDPAQPRLWCLLVERCVAAGVNGHRTAAVIGTEAMTREQVLGTIEAVRANATEWLGQPEHRALYGWLQAGDAETADEAG
jgi:hypothetical protein